MGYFDTLQLEPCEPQYGWCDRSAGRVAVKAILTTKAPDPPACQGFFVVCGSYIVAHGRSVREAIEAAADPGNDGCQMCPWNACCHSSRRLLPALPAMAIGIFLRTHGDGPHGPIALCHRHAELLYNNMWGQELDDYEYYEPLEGQRCMWCETQGEPERLKRRMAIYAELVQTSSREWNEARTAVHKAIRQRTDARLAPLVLSREKAEALARACHPQADPAYVYECAAARLASTLRAVAKPSGPDFAARYAMRNWGITATITTTMPYDDVTFPSGWASSDLQNAAAALGAVPQDDGVFLHMIHEDLYLTEPAAVLRSVRRGDATIYDWHAREVAAGQSTLAVTNAIASPGQITAEAWSAAQQRLGRES